MPWNFKTIVRIYSFDSYVMFGKSDIRPTFIKRYGSTFKLRDQAGSKWPPVTTV